ncbi:uncharacterized protein [Hetaerina americana]|uniref:uncharacterized protein n=1 Tax=Hetaerina americana TaxID=62018 RepID=UPI003A7F12EF
METEKGGQLPLFDVIVKRKSSGNWEYAVYRKSTLMERYLNVNTHHHASQYTALMPTIMHRVHTLSDTGSLETELINLTTALRRNGYITDMILKRTMKVDKKLCQLATHVNGEKEGAQPRARITIPYVAGTSEMIAKILNEHNVETRFNTDTKINRLLYGRKDNVPK